MADFGYDHIRIGLGDVLSGLTDGERAWRETVRAAAETLFGKFAEPGQLFLEKTPRNALFCREIIDTFEDAPVMFLWRNPLSVIASINRTWGEGRWKAYFYHYDLFAGLMAMIEAARDLESQPNIILVKYEDLVTRPNETWPTVFAHFGANYDEKYVASPPRLYSRMGDQTGQNKYDSTATQSIDLWKTAFGGTLRQSWAKNYLSQIGQDNLTFMGYNMAELLEGIDRNGDWHWSDPLYQGFAPLYHLVEPYALKSKGRRSGKYRFARR